MIFLWVNVIIPFSRFLFPFHPRLARLQCTHIFFDSVAIDETLFLLGNLSTKQDIPRLKPY